MTREKRIMTKTKIAAGAVLAVMAMSSFAAETEFQTEELLVTSTDFSVLVGDGWAGSLRYLDFSSNTEKAIPVEIRFESPGKRKVVYRIKYPGEAQHNAKEQLKWSRDGREINGQDIVSRSRKPNGALVLVTRGNGRDNNQSAEIRMTYSLNDTALTISKDVRYEGETDFFRRNSYELVR